MRVPKGLLARPTRTPAARADGNRDAAPVSECVPRRTIGWLSVSADLVVSAPRLRA